MSGASVTRAMPAHFPLGGGKTEKRREGYSGNCTVDESKGLYW